MIYYPLLTVVIATKDRDKFCIEAIKSILNISADLIQIAIADNSKSEEIKVYVESNPSDYISYYYDNSEISAIENFNRAMDLAVGEYVCMIGDDDTVLPNILNIVHWARVNKIDSICSTNTIAYYWPGASELGPTGMLDVPIFEPKIYGVDVEKELKKLIKSGIVNYLLYPLPKIYHGIVKRQLLLEIKARTGNYFGGLSPDIYSTITISCIVGNHFATTVPFSIAGACPKSSTVESIAGKHCGSLKDMPHLRNRGAYMWEEQIPEYYSVPTLWAESSLKAIKDLGKGDLHKQFNIYPLIAQGIIHNRKTILPLVIEKTNEWAVKHHKFIPFFYFQIFLQFINLTLRKLKSKPYSARKVFKDVTTIEQAVQIIERYDKIATIFE